MNYKQITKNGNLEYITDLIEHFYDLDAWPLNYIIFKDSYKIVEDKEFRKLIKKLGLTLKRSRKDQSIYILKDGTQNERKSK
jgi:hypothetical protein